LSNASDARGSDAKVHVRRDQRAEGLVAYLTIDDGRGLNVMSSAAVNALAESLLALADNQDLRAAVLTAPAPRLSASAPISTRWQRSKRANRRRR
jgi:enoyl-CoA hydratase/carnithine racemase